MNTGVMTGLRRPERMSSGTFTPRNDNALCRMLPRTEREGYTGLIELPEATDSRTAEQQDKESMVVDVVSVGSKVPGHDRGGIEPGDRVVVSRLAGDQIWVENQEHRIVRFDEVLGVTS